MDDAVSARREPEKAEPSASTGADDASTSVTSATMVAADASAKDTSATASATSAASPASGAAKADKKSAAGGKKKKQLKARCKRKHKGKGKCTSKQCFVHKKDAAGSDSDSDSDSSDDESEESDDSDSDSSDSDSSSEEDRKKRRRARKKKAAAKKKKAAAAKKKKKSRRHRDDDSDSDSESDSESEEESDTPRRRHKKRKPKAKAEASTDAAEPAAAATELAAVDPAAAAAVVDPAATNTAVSDLAQQLFTAFQNSAKLAATPVPVVIPVVEDAEKKKAKSKDKKKNGKPDYKRVDQLWDSNIHDYKLTETAEEQPDGFDGFIFHVRRRFDWENKYRSTVVDIKSKHLREALAEIMKDVKAISLAESEPSIDPNMLFLYLEEMRTFYSKTLKIRVKKEKKKKALKKLKTIRAHLKLMITYLDKDYEQTKKTLVPMLKSGTITFDLLWALFKPNTISYTTTYGAADHPRCFKVDQAYQDKSFTRGEYYVVEGRYLEYDGKDYGLGDFEIHIDHFKGPRKIAALATFPIQYHKDEKAIRAELIERGKKFVSLSGMNFKFMKGLAFQKRKKQLLKFNINGRVMIDPKTFRRVLANYMISSVKQNNDERDSDDDSCTECDNEVSDSYDDVPGSDAEEESGRRRYRVVGDGTTTRVVEVDSDEEDAPKEKFDKLPAGEGADDAKDRQFSEEELLIASPVVLGFSFTEKDWFEFSLSGVSDIVWNEGAFDSLVLPAAHKNIVKAQVSSHKFHGTETIDDIIQGKGKGLVFVLHGPPGVGKTLTAEGIAEFLKCPLYAVSAGDLGTDARIEHELNKIMDIAHSWGAVLLLDEADVFLEQREHQDVNRNALVSIFLRLLEYFQGILFLTTNRVETFDEAFQSRIHIALKYSELTRGAKREIWKMFLGKVAESGGASEVFKDADFDELSKSKLNGRQIKNTVKSAQALARHENVPLNMRHVKEVLEVAQAFERDLKGGTGYEDALRSYS